MTLISTPAKENDKWCELYPYLKDEAETNIISFDEMRFKFADDKASATLYFLVDSVSGLAVKDGLGKDAKTDWKATDLPEDRKRSYINVLSGEKASVFSKTMLKVLQGLDPAKAYKGKIRVCNSEDYAQYLTTTEEAVIRYIEGFAFKLDEVEASISDDDLTLRRASYSGKKSYGGQTEKERLADRLTFIQEQCALSSVETPKNLEELALLNDSNDTVATILLGFKLLLGS